MHGFVAVSCLLTNCAYTVATFFASNLSHRHWMGSVRAGLVIVAYYEIIIAVHQNLNVTVALHSKMGADIIYSVLR